MHEAVQRAQKKIGFIPFSQIPLIFYIYHTVLLY
ncbi:MAG: hypothetical protein ACI8RD_014817, partial [Bacillariaceae sp.]